MEQKFQMDDHYKQFVDEAFISPIRSVLIVDDEYPTIDGVLAQYGTKKGEESASGMGAPVHGANRIRNVIAKFRAQSPPLLLDIHDGQYHGPVDKSFPSGHLHQSDLVVLDYQLEGAMVGAGGRAIEILRRLLANKQFNLVVLYSKEEVSNVFTDVLLGTLNATGGRLTDEEGDKAHTLLAAAEDESSGFRERIGGSIGAAQYLDFRRDMTGYKGRIVRGLKPYGAFASFASGTAWSERGRLLVASFLLEQYEAREMADRQTIEGAARMTWSDERHPWLKAESLFVAFVQKGDDDDLLEALKRALYEWNPDPSRLFVAKTRAEMEEIGMSVQDQVLANRFACAYWYRELLRIDDAEEGQWRVAESVARHTERLLDLVLPGVVLFGQRMLSAERGSGTVTEICERRFGISLKACADRESAALEHNAFVCSKAPTGWHLTTGHIFEMCGDHWLCLSPACDLVPSQIAKWRLTSFGQCLPFIAVRLQTVKRTTALNDANSNRYLFLDRDGTVEAFGFNDLSRNDAAPEWHLLYATDAGRLTNGTFALLRTQLDGGSLSCEREQASIVGQLRYEYALNLVHKLGISLTRVGLGFTEGV